ncbi:MAG TPA: class I SAM-dependent methyltransferase [Promineifilum sp.]|nr:class I SAM-dependent methyltransferase [Promineifilum sp.]
MSKQATPFTDARKSLPSTLYTEEYFLTACEGYDVFLASEGAHLSRRLRDAFALADVRAGMRVLDVGCGRGEILRHCMRLGIEAHGMDYAAVATQMSREVVAAETQRAAAELQRPENEQPRPPRPGVCQADAKTLPFPDNSFDRVLMFDVVEHLFPWELQQAFVDIGRVLKPGGRLVIHTAPNRWYDTYAYPWVRRVRTLLGQGDDYPKDPRAITPVNQDVHVNEQDLLSMRRALKRGGYTGIRVWLDSPPQSRVESPVLAGLRRVAFGAPPFRWFFEREVFAVAEPVK